MEDDIPFADIPEFDPADYNFKCPRCQDYGMIGELTPFGDGEVDSVCDPCPDCQGGSNEN